MEAKKIQIKTLIISIASIIVIEMAHMVVVSKGLPHPLLVLGASRSLEIVMIVLVFLIWGKGLASVGLDLPSMASGLKKGLIWSICFGAVVSFAWLLLTVLGTNPLPLIHTYVPSRPGEIILFFFIGGIVGPFAEELFFRGVIYGFFRRWGVAVALVLSTAMFVLIHPLKGGLPITQVVGGIVFALAYEMGGSLVVPITVHALGNIAIFTLSLLY